MAEIQGNWIGLSKEGPNQQWIYQIVKKIQVVEVNIGGEILRTRVTPNVKSNTIHTEAYIRVVDQLGDYLNNIPGNQ